MTPTTVDAALLRRWPLPSPSGDADKDSRGSVLVIAGSREMPGAAWLAASAALRAGAGKLAVATAASVAPGLALALPESRVIGLRESRAGGLRDAGAASLKDQMDCVDAVLMGPGWVDGTTSLAFARKVLRTIGPRTPVVLDALGIGAIDDGGSDGPRLVTPHAGEMARLWGVSKDEVIAHALEFAVVTAERWQCVVALKGATTFVASPDGPTWSHRARVPGLGTSGSGDTLAGVIVGLAARGADLAQAAVWGVHLHARSGAALATKCGPLGYLASDLLREIPLSLHSLSPEG